MWCTWLRFRGSNSSPRVIKNTFFHNRRDKDVAVIIKSSSTFFGMIIIVSVINDASLVEECIRLINCWPVNIVPKLCSIYGTYISLTWPILFIWMLSKTFMLIKDTITILIINILEIQSTYPYLRRGKRGGGG